MTNPEATGELAAAAMRSDFQVASAAFHEALRTDDAGALFEFVADDVLLMPPGEGAVRGKTAMSQWYAGFLSRYRTVTFSQADRELLISNGLVVELGTFEWALAVVSDGSTVVDRGNYMQVWRSHPDGQWRFEREIWNSSIPA